MQKPSPNSLGVTTVTHLLAFPDLRFQIIEHLPPLLPCPLSLYPQCWQQILGPVLQAGWIHPSIVNPAFPKRHKDPQAASKARLLRCSSSELEVMHTPWTSATTAPILPLVPMRFLPLRGAALVLQEPTSELSIPTLQFLLQALGWSCTARCFPPPEPCFGRHQQKRKRGTPAL